jgi:F420H(2)-dependent quinone reductase
MGTTRDGKRRSDARELVEVRGEWAARAELPLAGTCDLDTVGRRGGQPRRVEIWYVVVDQRIVVTGTPGVRRWLGNLRVHPQAVHRLRVLALRLAVTAYEVHDPLTRRRIAEEVLPVGAARR